MSHHRALGEYSRAQTGQRLLYTKSEGPGTAQEKVFAYVQSTTSASTPIQEKVYAIQEDKQRWVDWVWLQRQRIKDGRGFERLPDALEVECTDGQLFVCWNDGRRVPVTLGQLVADMEWGRVYVFDPGTVDAGTQLRYAIAYARRKVEALRDLQIEAFESEKKDLEDEYKAAFHGIAINKELEQPGFIGEKLLASFFARMQYDARVPYEFRRADPYQDAYQKIDFLFHFPHWVRGVDVQPAEPGEARPMSGVQLSLGGQSAYRDKRQAIRDARDRLERKVDDVFLVFVQSRLVMDAYETWVEQGKPPGGPEAFLSSEAIEELLKVCLEDLVTPQAYIELVREIFEARGMEVPDLEVDPRAKERIRYFRALTDVLVQARDAEVVRGRDIRRVTSLETSIRRVDEAIRDIRATLDRDPPGFFGVDDRARVEGQMEYLSEKVPKLAAHRQFLRVVTDSYQEQQKTWTNDSEEMFGMLDPVVRTALSEAYFSEKQNAWDENVHQKIMVCIEFQLQNLITAAKEAYSHAYNPRPFDEDFEPSPRYREEEKQRYITCVCRVALLLLWSRGLRLRQPELLEALMERAVQEADY